MAVAGTNGKTSAPVEGGERVEILRRMDDMVRRPRHRHFTAENAVGATKLLVMLATI